MNQKIEDFQRRSASFRFKWEERKPKDVDFKNTAAVERSIQVVKETRIALVDFEKEKEIYKIYLQKERKIIVID